MSDTLTRRERVLLKHAAKALRAEFDQELAAAVQAERDAILYGLRTVAKLNGSGATILKAAGWDESKHPRDHGKFASKPGADGSPDEPSHLSPHPDPRTHTNWEMTRSTRSTEDDHQADFEAQLTAAVNRHLAGVERTVRAAGGDQVWEDNRGEVEEATKHYLRTAADAFRARRQAESERSEVDNLRKYALEVPETVRRPNHPGEGPSLHSREVERRLWDGDDEGFDEWYEGRKQEMDDHQQELADYHEKLAEYKDKKQEAKERAKAERRQEIAAQKMKAAKAVQAAKEAYADYRVARKQYNQTLYSVALDSHLVKKAWDADAHPRGQPTNAGQFTSTTGTPHPVTPHLHALAGKVQSAPTRKEAADLIRQAAPEIRKAEREHEKGLVKQAKEKAKAWALTADTGSRVRKPLGAALAWLLADDPQIDWGQDENYFSHRPTDALRDAHTQMVNGHGPGVAAEHLARLAGHPHHETRMGMVPHWDRDGTPEQYRRQAAEQMLDDDDLDEALNAHLGIDTDDPGYDANYEAHRANKVAHVAGLLADWDKHVEDGYGKVSKGFDSSKHPRGDDGRFVDAGHIAAAARDPKKAAELRAQVTDPEQRAKLDAALEEQGESETPTDQQVRGATNQQPPEEPAPGKRPTVDQSEALARRLTGASGPDRAETVRRLQEAFAGHSKAELNELKQRLGVKASGPQAEMARKLAERAAAFDRSNRNLYVNEKVSVDDAHSRITAMVKDGSLRTPQGVTELTKMIAGGLTGDELKELKGRLGIKASGAKMEVARKLVERATKEKTTNATTPTVEDVAPQPAAEAVVPAGATKDVASDVALSPDAVMNRSNSESYFALQRSLGVKKPQHGPDGLAQMQAKLSARPGGPVIAAILNANNSELHEAGYPDSQGDAVRQAINGRFTAPQLLDAAAWASGFDVRDGADRFLYGGIKTAKTSDGTIVPPDAFARMQQAVKLRRLADSHADKETRAGILRQVSDLENRAKSSVQPPAPTPPQPLAGPPTAESAPKFRAAANTFRGRAERLAAGFAAAKAAMDAPHDGSGLPPHPFHQHLPPGRLAELDRQHRAAKTKGEARAVQQRAGVEANDSESGRAANRRAEAEALFASGANLHPSMLEQYPDLAAKYGKTGPARPPAGAGANPTADPEHALRRIMTGQHPGYQHADITRALSQVEDAANGGPSVQPGKAGGDALRKLAANLGVPDAGKGDWRSLRTRIRDHVQAGAVRAGKGEETSPNPTDKPKK